MFPDVSEWNMPVLQQGAPLLPQTWGSNPSRTLCVSSITVNGLFDQSRLTLTLTCLYECKQVIKLLLYLFCSMFGCLDETSPTS